MVSKMLDSNGSRSPPDPHPTAGLATDHANIVDKA
jgi:hypothetical protein